MFNGGLAAMMPTLEKMFSLKRRVLADDEAAGIAAASGIDGAAVVRIDGAEGGKPFVMFIASEHEAAALPGT